MNNSLENTSKRIEIIVKANGESTVATSGFTGTSCRAASKFIEDALGSRTSEHLTSEFYQTHQVDQQSSQHQAE